MDERRDDTEKSGVLPVVEESSEGLEDPLFPLFVTPNRFQPKNRRQLRTPKRKFQSETGEEESPRNKERPRTPSGQVLTSSIGDIKSLFEAKIVPEKPLKIPNLNSVTRDGAITRSFDHEQSVNIGANHVETELITPESLSAFNIAANYHLGINLQDKRSKCAEIKEKGMASESPISTVEDMEADQSLQSATNTPVAVGIQQIEEIQRKMETEGQTNPTVDVRTVIKMFEDIKTTIVEGFQNGAQHEKCAQKDIMERKCSMLEARISVCETKERMMTNTMASFSDKIKELQDKLELNDINVAKKMFVLSGFEASSKKYICRQQLEAFLHNEMGTSGEIDDFYFVGSGVEKPKDIVITMQSIQKKKEIFRNVSKVKNYVNSMGKKYMFRDFLTVKQNDMRKRCQEAADRMMEEEDMNQQEITLHQGKMFVGDNEFKPEVVPPDPTHVLQIPMQKLNEIMMIPVQRGPLVQHKGNNFIGYLVSAGNTRQVQDAYMKIRLSHAEARHIICAYNVPGIDVIQNANHCDDEDYGASQALLELLVKNKLNNRAVFVVRNCGEKLYEERIPTYIRAARAVIDKFPWNDLLKVNQTLQPVQEADNANGQIPKKWGRVNRGFKKTSANQEGESVKWASRGGRRGGAAG